MEQCRACGTPVAGDVCAVCGTPRGANPWDPNYSGPPTVPMPAVPPILTPPAYGPPTHGTPPVASPYAVTPLTTTPLTTTPLTTAPSRTGLGRHLPWITGVLAGLLVVGVGYLALGVPGTPTPVPASATPTTKTTTTATASPTQVTPTSAPITTLTPPVTPSATPTETPTTTYPDVVVPAGSRECARTGPGPLDAVGTANESTSCPFAINVRDAYVAAGLNGTDGHITAFSPTTNQSYDMTCTGAQPVICSGGRAARVVLYGGRLLPA